MIKLSVNINKIATLRNARGGNVPNVVQAAQTCIEAGCHGITVHPRPDERHIRYQDVYDLQTLVTGQAVEFNIEGYPSPELLELVCKVRPTQCTLVPDAPDVLTSDQGWNLQGDGEWLRPILERLHGNGVRTSLFLVPDTDQIRRAQEIGTDRIELYTERYAHVFGTPAQDEVSETYYQAALTALKIGLDLNAGHDLNLENLPHFSQNVPGLLEVSIGHALICDALYLGLRPAVRAYLQALGYDTPEQ